ncbi:MAG: 2-amino-4-hydroxy-6-hydroxymethyldihydropteridine diphosphokinase [Pseudomonadota bacterium]
MPLRQDYLVALGANLPSELGPPAETLRHALSIAIKYKCKLINCGTFFSTPAFPAGNGPDFVNGAVALEGPGDPKEMIAILHEIEAELGRERTQRWGQRVIDLDLLAAGDQVLPDEATHAEWRGLSLDEQQSFTPDTLILPHPRLHERAFVLVPLAVVAPHWRHPILGKTVEEMRDALPKEDLASVTPME